MKIIQHENLVWAEVIETELLLLSLKITWCIQGIHIGLADMTPDMQLEIIQDVLGHPYWQLTCDLLQVSGHYSQWSLQGNSDNQT